MRVDGGKTKHNWDKEISDLQEVKLTELGGCDKKGRVQDAASGLWPGYTGGGRAEPNYQEDELRGLQV